MATRSRMLPWIAAAAAMVGLYAYLAVGIFQEIRRANDVRLTVTATRPDGSAPSGEELDRASEVLHARLKAAGLDDPAVSASDDGRLVLRAGGDATEIPRELIASGEVEFRRVVQAVPPAGGPGGPPPSTSPEPDAPPGRLAVADKLGEAYAAAEAVTRPEDGAALPRDVRDAFAALTPAEVADLPPRMRLLVPSITCRQLTEGPPAASPPDRPTVLCDETTKYLLDSAVLTGPDIASARSELSQTGDWIVSIEFTPDGGQRFAALTRELAPSQGQVAIVLDTTVVSAPTIEGEVTGPVQISGDFTRTDTGVLAALLGGDDLPLRLTVDG